jgi:hypothetical protein
MAKKHSPIQQIPYSLELQIKKFETWKHCMEILGGTFFSFTLVCLAIMTCHALNLVEDELTSKTGNTKMWQRTCI